MSWNGPISRAVSITDTENEEMPKLGLANRVLHSGNLKTTATIWPKADCFISSCSFVFKSYCSKINAVTISTKSRGKDFSILNSSKDLHIDFTHWPKSVLKTGDTLMENIAAVAGCKIFINYQQFNKRNVLVAWYAIRSVTTFEAWLHKTFSHWICLSLKIRSRPIPST